MLHTRTVSPTVCVSLSPSPLSLSLSFYPPPSAPSGHRPGLGELGVGLVSPPGGHDLSPCGLGWAPRPGMSSDIWSYISTIIPRRLPGPRPLTASRHGCGGLTHVFCGRVRVLSTRLGRLALPSSPTRVHRREDGHSLGCAGEVRPSKSPLSPAGRPRRPETLNPSGTPLPSDRKTPPFARSAGGSLGAGPARLGSSSPPPRGASLQRPRAWRGGGVGKEGEGRAERPAGARGRSRGIEGGGLGV